VSATHPPGGDVQPYAPDVRPVGITTATTIAILAIVALLMIFSVVSWLLDNTTLAAVAGTAACTLAADVIRRLLGLGLRGADRAEPIGQVSGGRPETR
jgi:hypothetical protein